jgi:hypothetical protein
MLRRYLAGDGRLDPTTDGWRLEVNPTTGYNDAQVDDTHGRFRRISSSAAASIDARSTGFLGIASRHLGFGL